MRYADVRCGLVQVNGTKVCMGADVLDQQAMRIMRFMAPVTMLATGGAGQVLPLCSALIHATQ